MKKSPWFSKKVSNILSIVALMWIFFIIFLSKVYGETLIGSARVIDGDTIEVRGEKIRMLCIDTPESYYRGRTQYCLDNETDCGLLAKVVLMEEISHKEVICEYTKRDVYGRILGMCQKFEFNFDVNYKETLNYKMVEEGYAWFYEGGKQCKPFKEAFENARKNKIGLFDSDLGGFKEPKLWRKTRSND